jgi:hypothetical protein
MTCYNSSPRRAVVSIRSRHDIRLSGRAQLPSVPFSGITNAAGNLRDSPLSNKLLNCGKAFRARLHLLRTGGRLPRRPAAKDSRSRWSLRLAGHRRPVARRGLASEDPPRDHRQCTRLHRLLLQSQRCPHQELPERGTSPSRRTATPAAPRRPMAHSRPVRRLSNA